MENHQTNMGIYTTNYKQPGSIASSQFTREYPMLFQPCKPNTNRPRDSNQQFLGSCSRSASPGPGDIFFAISRRYPNSWMVCLWEHPTQMAETPISGTPKWMINDMKNRGKSLMLRKDKMQICVDLDFIYGKLDNTRYKSVDPQSTMLKKNWVRVQRLEQL